MVLLFLLATIPLGVTDIIRTSQSLSICQDISDTKLYIFDWGGGKLMACQTSMRDSFLKPQLLPVFMPATIW